MVAIGKIKQKKELTKYKSATQNQQCPLAKFEESHL